MSNCIEPWKACEIAEAVGGRIVCGNGDAIIRGVTTDSRSIPPKSIFFALKGEKHDAHLFVPHVINEGAIAAIVDRSLPVPHFVTLIQVEDTTRALGDFALAYRKKFSVQIAGVTGSSGKTSVKNFLAGISRRRYRTVSTTGNLNNHIGVPLTLFNLKSKTEKAVIEMGMSVRGEIARLCEIAAPSLGIITSVGPCHLETLGSIDEIINAKSELTEYLNLKDGVIILPSDSAHFDELRSRAKCRVVSAGTREDSDVRITELNSDGFAPASFVFRGIPVCLKLPGRHMALNAALAAAAALEMGIDSLDIVEGLGSVFPETGRALAHKLDGVTLVDDAYNSNPLSLSAGISMLSDEEAERRILVMSDMLELGKESNEEHAKIGRLISEKKIDVLIYRGEKTSITAEESKNVKKIECRDNDEMAEIILKTMRQGDVILVKASHGMRLDEVVRKVIDRKISSTRAQVISMRK